MRVFVTGGTGFAGSHLIEALLTAGNTVYALVHPASSHQPLPDTVHPVTANIMDLPALRQIVQDCQPEVIYHLAGLSAPAQSWQNPALTLQVNSGGTANLLEAARSAGNPRVIIITSADIYGKINPTQLPITETTPPNPLHPYGISKLAASQFAPIYWQRYQLPVIEARPFNHIGPRQTLGFVVPDFASQIAGIKQHKQTNIMKVGNLDVNRDFTDVRDVVQAYIALAEGGAPGESYLICSGQAVSIHYLLNSLLEIAAIPVNIEYDPSRMRPADNPTVYGSSDKIYQKTGWQPCRHLRQSLTDVLAEWEEKLANESS